MSTSEFLQIVRRGNVKEIMDYICADEEFLEYRETAPLPDCSNMTRKEKIEVINDIIMTFTELAENKEERNKQERHNELRKLIYHQCIPKEETLDTLREYCRREKNNPAFKDEASNKTLLAIEMFLYGKICGIRQERARRRRKQV